jgi:pimeloyl-ACP methyl ester carboxylesterase
MWLGRAPNQLFAYSGGKHYLPDRPTIVFIHGAQHDHSVWILQSRALAHLGYGVLALDLPGHGRSDGPARPSVETISDALAEALAPLPVPGLLLVGHSMGSLIALELARRMADSVRGVALLGAAFPMRVADTLLAATRDEPEAAFDMINVWSHAPSIVPFAPRPGCPAPGFNVVWQNLRLMQRIARVNGKEVLPTDFHACNAYDNGRNAALLLHCPALFVLGSADLMTPPKSAQGLVDAIATEKQVVVLPDIGHNMMAEHPDGVRRALEQFARRALGEPRRVAA